MEESNGLENRSPIKIKTIIQLLVVMTIIPFSPLLISRRWGWWQAWVYAVIYVLGFVVSRGLAARRHPDLLAERARFTDQEDAEPWDKILAPLVGLGGGLIPVVAGLDAFWGWSGNFSPGWQLGSLAVILVGYGISSWALIVNRFFSGMVRIQRERGHRVVSSGPYGWIRHPGYAGALLVYLASPVLLDSAWAYLPVVCLMTVLVIRTRMEDQKLQKDLEGYQAYAGRVSARLIPGVW